MDEKTRNNTPDELVFEGDRGEAPAGPSVTTGSSLDLGVKKPLSTSVKLFVGSILAFLIGMGVLRSLLFKGHLDGVSTATTAEAEASIPNVEQRKALPDILLKGEDGTQSKKLSDYKGKVVLLSFWASWCTPCLVELPTFMELYNKLSDQGLVIIPINVDEPDAAKEFVPGYWKNRKFPFPTFFDADKSASTAFEIQSLPSNFVIDKQGRLVAQGLGANDWTSESSTSFLEALLKE